METEDQDLIQSAGFAERFPDTNEEAELAEELLANELANLMLVEKDKIMFDVHGINSVEHDEEPGFVKQSLEDLEVAICKLKKKSEYEKAKYLNESYVTSEKFRLMFLRSENFDTKLAAKKIAEHFRIKKELFGSGEILARDVRLSDMSDDDMESLESGALQVLPTRDAAGRSIFCILPFYKVEKSQKCLVSIIVKRSTK